jgi:hypothetical protein
VTRRKTSSTAEPGENHTAAGDGAGSGQTILDTSADLPVVIGIDEGREPATEPQTALRVVTGITVRTRRPHEHDGTVHPPGAELTLPCDVASALIQEDAVRFIRKEESLP